MPPRYLRQPLPVKHRPLHLKRIAILLLVLLVLVLNFRYRAAHSLAPDKTIRSGLQGVCLDLHHNGASGDVIVDSSGCNRTLAQSWTTTDTAIKRSDNRCVTVGAHDAIIISPCQAEPEQVWLREQQSYYNPATDHCLAISNRVGKQLTAAICKLSSPLQQWLVGKDSKAPACGGQEGDKIACETIKEWGAWQAAGSNHEALLTNYTDGTPYEEWCADFISYVYKESGHAFTNGSADGWDENDSNQIQNMGFTMHPVGSGYVPRAGDVAFFNYPGGHVEIVVSGGAKPTFIYGDSATVDPTTGNGQMKANTITSDDQMGQVVYYLSPV